MRAIRLTAGANHRVELVDISDRERQRLSRFDCVIVHNAIVFYDRQAQKNGEMHNVVASYFSRHQIYGDVIIAGASLTDVPQNVTEAFLHE